MTVNALIEMTGYKPLLISDGDREITGGYAGDLLSWVMGRAESGDCWVTIMSNVNVAAVGQLTDCACIVFSEDVRPDETAVNAARTHGLNLLLTEKSTFEVCVEVGALLK
jgi:hypothetical protein